MLYTYFHCIICLSISLIFCLSVFIPWRLMNLWSQLIKAFCVGNFPSSVFNRRAFSTRRPFDMGSLIFLLSIIHCRSADSILIFCPVRILFLFSNSYWLLRSEMNFEIDSLLFFIVEIVDELRPYILAKSEFLNPFPRLSNIFIFCLTVNVVLLRLREQTEKWNTVSRWFSSNSLREIIVIKVHLTNVMITAR